MDGGRGTVGGFVQFRSRERLEQRLRRVKMRQQKQQQQQRRRGREGGKKAGREETWQCQDLLASNGGRDGSTR